MVQLSVLATKQQPTAMGDNVRCVCVCVFMNILQMFQQQGGYQRIVTPSLIFKLHLKQVKSY